MIGLSGDVPAMRKGGLSPIDWILAPIFANGAMIRFIGRKLSDSSPINSEVKLLPASTPASMRIVEPLFPQSSGPSGARSWCGGSMVTLFGDLLTPTPSCSRQARVDWQSRLVEKFCNCDGPSAIPAMSAARCEIDLSPGRRIVPLMRLAGATFMVGNLNLHKPQE